MRNVARSLLAPDPRGEERPLWDMGWGITYKSLDKERLRAYSAEGLVIQE